MHAHKKYLFPVFFCGLFLFIAMLSSCTSTKKVIYFNDLTVADSAAFKAAQNVFQTPIQKNDQLWITVGGTNLIDLTALNSASGFVGGASGGSVSGGSSVLGYLVEADGKIKVPYLGKIQAEGLTRLQLEDFLTEKFKDYTKNPVVNVRFLNYSVTLIGEVARPGRYAITTERISILDAISQAGDITYLGKSDNIMVIREENGKRTFNRINLLSKGIFASPFFYLKTNDVVYVEPVKAKFISRAGVPQYLSLVAVGLSLILTIINLRK